MKNKILALIIGVGILGGSAFTAFATSTTDTSSTTDNNATKSCCTQNAQCCKEKAPCCK